MVSFKFYLKNLRFFCKFLLKLKFEMQDWKDLSFSKCCAKQRHKWTVTNTMKQLSFSKLECFALVKLLGLALPLQCQQRALWYKAPSLNI
jgi:hypothetical protein